MNILRTFDYIDCNGKPYQKVRMDTADKDQRFKRRQPDGNGGWIWSWEGIQPTLYNREKLKDCNDYVFICAGEHDCDSISKLGWITTTNPESESASWKAEYTECFDPTVKGVYILADQDPTGEKHAIDVAQSIYGHVPFVKIINVPTGKDASEFIEGISPKDAVAAIWKLCGETPKWQPIQQSHDATTESKLLQDRESFEFLSPAGVCECLIENLTTKNLQASLKELAEAMVKLDSIGKQLLRSPLIVKLQTLGIKGAAKLADSVLSESKAEEKSLITFAETKLWPEPVDGGATLAEISAIYSKYLTLPKYADVVHCLWDLHTHCLDAFFASPILFIQSPTPRAAKTRTYEIKMHLVARALISNNASVSVVYRAIDKYHPTILFDEIDSFTNGQNGKEELRGIINSGNTRLTAYVLRCDGDNFEPRNFSTWGARALAGIGKTHDTWMDRAITIRMRRRKKSEPIARLRQDRLESELGPIRSKMARWATDNIEQLRTSDPPVPNELNDRAQDFWRPLLAIADLAGESWPEKARAAALGLSQAEEEAADAKIWLLTDFYEYFKDHDCDRVWTNDFIEHLKTLENRKWAIWNQQKPISAYQIAALLKDFEIRPQTVWMGEKSKKGYQKEQFIDTWPRYLEKDPSGPSESSTDAAFSDFQQPSETPNLTDYESDLSDCKQTRLTGLTDENTNTRNCKHKIAKIACSVCHKKIDVDLNFDGLGVS